MRKFIEIRGNFPTACDKVTGLIGKLYDVERDLFSILMLPAPFALLTGILAVRDIRRNPHKHGMGRAVFGIVMGGLVSLLLVASFVLPHLMN